MYIRMKKETKRIENVVGGGGGWFQNIYVRL